ncbi:pantoate--beta-alanine ligase, partial [Salinicola salarius]|uniref:pantoate--beta-alanine ligase n=1 Tax=Salinicola salarius TaxID=430457 RepID=UPI0026EEF57A
RRNGVFMQVLQNRRQMSRACRSAKRPLGLVPTMGALHEGHMALVKQARKDNSTLAATIFVNPSQFGPQEDLSAYPRDLERDLALLREEGVDLVFTPSVEEIYPPGFNTWVDVGGLGDRLEGAHRSGHFRGVATVVAKLFNIIGPDRAYFGQKDGQQSAVIRKMVRDLDLDVEVVMVPTVRDSDGLALSSRNAYLTEEQRRAAPVVYRALQLAQRLWQEGITDGSWIRSETRLVLESEGLIERIDYVSVANAETLDCLPQLLNTFVDTQLLDTRLSVGIDETPFSIELPDGRRIEGAVTPSLRLLETTTEEQEV